MMKRIATAAVFFVLISACESNEIGHSRDVNQDEICQTYYVTYDEATDRTEIIAWFRFAGPNGTTLILDSTSRVELDNEELNEIQDKNSGCSYHKNMSGKMPEGDHIFAFTDMNGKRYENKLDFRPVEIESIPDTISLAEGLTIRFTDKPDGRKEDMTVEISDDSTFVSESWTQVHLERVKFPKEKLQQLKGNISISIRREGNFELKQKAHPGGTIYTEYMLAPRKAVLKS